MKQAVATRGNARLNRAAPPKIKCLTRIRTDRTSIYVKGLRGFVLCGFRANRALIAVRRENSKMIIKIQGKRSVIGFGHGHKNDVRRNSKSALFVAKNIIPVVTQLSVCAMESSVIGPVVDVKSVSRHGLQQRSGITGTRSLGNLWERRLADRTP